MKSAHIMYVSCNCDNKIALSHALCSLFSKHAVRGKSTLITDASDCANVVHSIFYYRKVTNMARNSLCRLIFFVLTSIIFKNRL